MYKYSKDGVSVLTVLDKRKQKKNGLFPIKVQVIYNRKQKYYSSGQAVSIQDWERLPHAKSRQLSEIRRNIENSFSLIKLQVEILSFQGEFHFDTLNARLGKYSELSLNTLFKINHSMYLFLSFFLPLPFFPHFLNGESLRSFFFSHLLGGKKGNLRQ